AALALPVSDGVINKLELTQSPKIGDGEDRIEHALQSGIFSLVRKKIHLQKPLIRFLLNFDQIGNRDRGLDSREIHSLARCAVCQIFHFHSYGRWARNSFEEYKRRWRSPSRFMRRKRRRGPGCGPEGKEKSTHSGIISEIRSRTTEAIHAGRGKKE